MAALVPSWGYREVDLPPDGAVAKYEVIVASGDPVPGFDPGVTFATLSGAFIDPSTEEVAFLADVAGADFETGAFATHADRPRLASRLGDAVDFGPSDAQEAVSTSFDQIVHFDFSSVFVSAQVDVGGGALHRAYLDGDRAWVEGQTIVLENGTATGAEVVLDELIGVSFLRKLYGSIRVSGPEIETGTDIRIYSLSDLGAFLSSDKLIASKADGFRSVGEVDGFLRDSPAPFASSGPGAAFVADVPEEGADAIGLFQLAGAPYRVWNGRLPSELPVGSSVTITGGVSANSDHSWVATAEIEEPGSGSYEALIGKDFASNSGEYGAKKFLSVGDQAAWAGRGASVVALGEAAIGQTAEYESGGLQQTIGAVVVVKVWVEGAGIDESNDECLVFLDRANRPHVLAREGATVTLDDGSAGVITGLDSGSWAVSDDDAVAMVLELDQDRDVLVRARLVEPTTAVAPIPVQSTNFVPTSALEEPGLAIRGAGSGKRAKFRTSKSKMILRGNLTGSATRVEWREVPRGKIRAAKASEKFRLRFRLSEGRNRFQIRSVTADGRKTRWERVVIVRRSNR